MPNQRKYGSSRKGRKTGDKWCVARHRTQCARSADQLERAIEKRERRAAQEEIASQLNEYEQED